MKFDTETLISDLIERTKQNINSAEQFKQLPLEAVNWKLTPNSWSVLECLEHLNLYGDYYLPEIDNKIINTKYNTETNVFKSSWLGNYFANLMLPKPKMKKMKTLKDKNPSGSNLDLNTIDRFINQQKETLNLLNKARRVDLNKTKTGMSLTNLLKFRLGDTFRFTIYHNQRHVQQANNVLKDYNSM